MTATCSPCVMELVETKAALQALALGGPPQAVGEVSLTLRLSSSLRFKETTIKSIRGHVEGFFSSV